MLRHCNGGKCARGRTTNTDTTGRSLSRCDVSYVLMLLGSAPNLLNAGPNASRRNRTAGAQLTAEAATSSWQQDRNMLLGYSTQHATWHRWFTQARHHTAGTCPMQHNFGRQARELERYGCRFARSRSNPYYRQGTTTTHKSTTPQRHQSTLDSFLLS